MNTTHINREIMPVQNKTVFSPAWKALEEHYSSQNSQDQFKSWNRFKSMMNDSKDTLSKLLSVDPSFVFKLAAWEFQGKVTQYAPESEQSLFKSSIPPFLRLTGTVLDVMKLKKTLSTQPPGEKNTSPMAKGVDIAHVMGDFAAIAGNLMTYYSPGPVGHFLVNAGYLSDLLSISYHGMDYFIAKQEAPLLPDCSGSPPDKDSNPDSGSGHFFKQDSCAEKKP